MNAFKAAKEIEKSPRSSTTNNLAKGIQSNIEMTLNWLSENNPRTKEQWKKLRKEVGGAI